MHTKASTTLRNALRTLSVAFLMLAVFLTVATPAFASAPTGNVDLTAQMTLAHSVVVGKNGPNASNRYGVDVIVPKADRNAATATMLFYADTTEVEAFAMVRGQKAAVTISGDTLTVTNPSNLYDLGYAVTVYFTASSTAKPGDRFGLGNVVPDVLGNLVFGAADDQQVYWQDRIGAEEGEHGKLIAFVRVANANEATFVDFTVKSHTRLSVYTDDGAFLLGVLENSTDTDSLLTLQAPAHNTFKGVTGSPYLQVVIEDVNPQTRPAAHTIGVTLP